MDRQTPVLRPLPLLHRPSLEAPFNLDLVVLQQHRAIALDYPLQTKKSLSPVSEQGWIPNQNLSLLLPPRQRRDMAELVAPLKVRPLRVPVDLLLADILDVIAPRRVSHLASCLARYRHCRRKQYSNS